MSIKLPKPIAAYFTTDAGKVDRDAVAQCFTENAVVKDEGHTYNGRAAIKQWKESSSTKFQYTSEPLRSLPSAVASQRHLQRRGQRS